MGIQVKDRNLQTPLHYAVKFDEKNNFWHGNLTTVNFLLEKKAVKDSWDKTGQRPKDVAKRNPHSIVELLLQSDTIPRLTMQFYLIKPYRTNGRGRKS
jgi:ankyrin repeat protein